MLDGLTPDLAPRLVLAIGGVGIAFVVLILVLIFLKRRNSPLFIKGGKGREPRLMVLDAAAVDPKRRLVLIRRDEVEHLIMIGGPTDIVIESGIVDRARPAAAARTLPAEDSAQPRAVPATVAEPRPVQPAAERRAEPVRPVPAQAERSPALQADPRIAQPAVATVTRTATPTASASEKIPEKVAAERLVERPQVDRKDSPDDKGVSAMGALLYGGSHEPMAGGKPTSPISQSQATQTPPVRAETAALPSVERREQPFVQPPVSSAEAALDAARSRVLQNPTPSVTGQPVTVADAEKVLAARQDAARMEAMRRVQSAQPAVSTSLPNPVQPPVQRTDPHIETLRTREAEPSDFEKLLEAELDASGVFAGQPPQVRSDDRVANTVPAAGVVPPVRVTPPITGATADLTSEEDVARLLGEIAVNRKP